jgi:carbon storage regulator
MLCLTRKTDQQIIIVSAIRITILAARGGVVRVGIEAPEGLAIHRRAAPPFRSDRPRDGNATDDRDRRLMSGSRNSGRSRRSGPSVRIQ